MALFSKRSLEGYLLVDHRAGEGVARDLAVSGGAMPVGNGAMMEMPTVTCSHCQKVLIVNPGRTRERGYCPKCDHYVCDECETARVASGGNCRTFKQLMDEVEEASLKGKSPLILLP